VAIEFEDGTLKTIIARLRPQDHKSEIVDDGIFQLRNDLPIGMSGKFSPARLRLIEMHAYDPVRVQKLFRIDTTIYDESKKDSVDIEVSDVKIKVADLIDFRLIPESGKADYSPANQVVTLTPITNDIILKKEKRSQILEIRTYTDLIGVDAAQPNGLIQFEGRKKIFLLDTRRGMFGYLGHPYIGTLTYFEPIVRFSKIDENNRNLFPDTIGSATNLVNSKQKILNINTIDLYKYQQHSISFNLNVANISAPQLKFNFLIDLKAGLYRTGITDSLTITSGRLVKTDKAFTSIVNTTMYGVNLYFQLLPDSRYGLSFGYSIFKNSLLNNNYIQNAGASISTYWLDGSLKTTDSSTLFIRGTFNHQTNNTKLNYVQAQLGVSFNIFKSNSK
jgi:hypothetical protein